MGLIIGWLDHCLRALDGLHTQLTRGWNGIPHEVQNVLLLMVVVGIGLRLIPKLMQRRLKRLEVCKLFRMELYSQPPVAPSSENNNDVWLSRAPPVLALAIFQIISCVKGSAIGLAVVVALRGIGTSLGSPRERAVTRCRLPSLTEIPQRPQENLDDYHRIVPD